MQLSIVNLRGRNRRGRCGGGGCGGQARGGGGGQGQCSSASDCPDWAPLCSSWGYCQTRAQPDGEPQAGQCGSSSDCPAWAPTCSKWGYCQGSSGKGSSGGQKRGKRKGFINKTNKMYAQTQFLGGRKAGRGGKGGKQTQKTVF